MHTIVNTLYKYTTTNFAFEYCPFYYDFKPCSYTLLLRQYISFRPIWTLSKVPNARFGTLLLGVAAGGVKVRPISSVFSVSPNPSSKTKYIISRHLYMV